MSSLKFVPVGPPPTYALASQLILDNADADGHSTNVVNFYLTYGGESVAGRLILFVTDRLPMPVTTGPDGLYTASISSATPGSIEVRAELYEDRDVFTVKTINFTPVVTYPIYLGSNTITTPGDNWFIGLQPLLRSFDIIAGHVYRIEGLSNNLIPPSDCSNGHTFDYLDQLCGTSFTIDYTHLMQNSLTPVLALRSGLGQNLHSVRYSYTNTAESFTVQVYDDGPA